MIMRLIFPNPIVGEAHVLIHIKFLTFIAKPDLVSYFSYRIDLASPKNFSVWDLFFIAICSVILLQFTKLFEVFAQTQRSQRLL
jgi:hypothetical protein